MVDTIKVCYVTFEVDSSNLTATSLRGYLGYLFANDPEFHHHSGSSHHYPRVQYKKINDKLLVLGFSDYADIVFERLSQLEFLITQNEKIPINNIDLKIKKIQVTPDITNYRFVTPWIGLNEKNYRRILELKNKEKKALLQRILIGNILSMLKGLGIRINFRVNVEISKLKSTTAIAHDNKFAGFYCNCQANIVLPEYCGLGKSVSKGFGVLIPQIDS